VRPGWSLPFASPPVSAVFEKEVRYLLRSGPALLQLIIPLILIVFFGFSMRQSGAGSGKHGNPFAHLPTDWAFPIAVGYAFLIQTNLVYNSFSYEGNGVQFLFLAPVRFRDVMEGKNLYHLLFTFFEAALVGIGMSLFFTPPRLMIVVATLAAVLFASLANFSVGNLLSLSFPKRLEFGALRQRNVSGVTMAASLGMQSFLLSFCTGIFFLTNYFHHFWLAPWIFLILVAAVTPGYLASLNYASKLALDRREVLTAELCRQD
jgi:ABC-2 type transport system permease protein